MDRMFGTPGLNSSAQTNGLANHGGLKQKSDIEHYRNKLRQKARRKGYGEFSLSETGSHGYSHRDARHGRHDNGLKEPMTAEEKRASFAGCHKRYSHPREPTYWSRQSLSSPSPVETEMDLLVLRERSRRGIRNNGYDETNVDRLMSSLGYGGGSTGTGNGSLGVKAHRGSDSSTLSSQPSIDEVRTQMHMLLGNAFSLAPPDHDPPSPPTNTHHHHHHHAHRAYNPSHTSHYSDGVTSAPGTMNHPCGGRQRSTGYEDMHQCSLPKPIFPSPLSFVTSVRPLVHSSTPDVSLKPRVSEASDLQAQQHNGAPYLPLSRTPFPAVTVDQSISTYSGNPITAVYAISANRPGYSDYFVMSPPSSYRSPSWMSYPPEPEDLPRQWNDTPGGRRTRGMIRSSTSFDGSVQTLSSRPLCWLRPLCRLSDPRRNTNQPKGFQTRSGQVLVWTWGPDFDRVAGGEKTEAWPQWLGHRNNTVLNLLAVYLKRGLLDCVSLRAARRLSDRQSVARTAYTCSE
ncbi:UPF0606 protein KIAA1549L [Collichthys lucidus]|uniref:UPF0606 protein KIAA1549L n=1 Tax=Collichthys lucidus TaxID=240159 RepID=A0A4U5UFV6_COLLU|nr:UPF0606 protein KIAA1549L [Collichthys lucidus]